jgi:hypothetical protein
MFVAHHESTSAAGTRRGMHASSVVKCALLVLTVGGSSGALAEGEPCDENKVLAVAPEFRLEAALNVIRGGCLTIPGPVWSAAEQGKYPDGTKISVHQRVLMINTAISKGRAEAESLSVFTLENGAFPGGPEIAVESGAELVEGLAPALTPYRTGLLLDIYEQVNNATVRNAVIRSMRSSDRPEAILPALDAYWNTPAARLEAQETFKDEPEKEPDAILARVISTLPEGPALDWALRISESADGELSMKAAKERAK